MQPKDREGSRASISGITDVDASGPLPVAPDGGIMPLPNLAPEMPPLEWVPESCVCLRGPCRYYMEVSEVAQVETRGLEFHPEEVARFCTAIPGAVLEVQDCVLRCSRWDPRDEDPNLKRRRERFMKSLTGTSCTKADEDRSAARAVAMRRIDEAAKAKEISDEAPPTKPYEDDKEE